LRFRYPAGRIEPPATVQIWRESGIRSARRLITGQ
jgi:hypothetical protein